MGLSPTPLKSNLFWYSLGVLGGTFHWGISLIPSEKALICFERKKENDRNGKSGEKMSKKGGKNFFFSLLVKKTFSITVQRRRKEWDCDCFSYSTLYIQNKSRTVNPAFCTKVPLNDHSWLRAGPRKNRSKKKKLLKAELGRFYSAAGRIR